MMACVRSRMLLRFGLLLFSFDCIRGHIPSEPKDEDETDICRDPTVDTMLTSAEGRAYAFKGSHYWRLTDDGIAPGYPKLISETWVGLPYKIDAAFTSKTGNTYFFKENQYWRYTGKTMDSGYPKLISEGFAGIPDNLDAATVWSGNDKMYFFKGPDFWRFDPTTYPHVRGKYPKPIHSWIGIPDNLDAVLTYKGTTYFFKGPQYWRFHDGQFAVDTGDPPFPRPTARWWLGCPETPTQNSIGQEPPSTGQESPSTGQESPSTGKEPPSTGQEPPSTGRALEPTGHSSISTEPKIDSAAAVDRTTNLEGYIVGKGLHSTGRGFASTGQAVASFGHKSDSSGQGSVSTGQSSVSTGHALVPTAAVAPSTNLETHTAGQGLQSTAQAFQSSGQSSYSSTHGSLSTEHAVGSAALLNPSAKPEAHNIGQGLHSTGLVSISTERALEPTVPVERSINLEARIDNQPRDAGTYTVETNAHYMEALPNSTIIFKCRIPKALIYCRMEIPGFPEPVLLIPGPQTPGARAVYDGFGFDKGHCGLKLSAIDEANSGQIKCILGAADLTESSQQMTLTVMRAPSLELRILSSDPSAENQTEGQTITLECSASKGRPVSNLTWFIGTKALTEGLSSPIIVKEDPDLYSVSQNFTRLLQASDNGKEVGCVAGHIGLQPSDSVKALTLRVQFAPKPWEHPHQPIGLLEGQEGEIVVSVQANPRPVFVWKIGDERLYEGYPDADNKYAVTQSYNKEGDTWTSVLKINRISREDTEKKYGVIASNSQGERDYEIHVFLVSEPKYNKIPDDLTDSDKEKTEFGTTTVRDL